MINPKIGSLSKKLMLLDEARSLLRQAGCDAVTGERMNRDYKRKAKALADLARKRERERERRFGKMGAASPVRRIDPTGEVNGDK